MLDVVHQEDRSGHRPAGCCNAEGNVLAYCQRSVLSKYTSVFRVFLRTLRPE